MDGKWVLVGARTSQHVFVGRLILKWILLHMSSNNDYQIQDSYVISFCNATQLKIAIPCAGKCSSQSQYYRNHCPNMSKVVVKYPRIWIESPKNAEPCSCFSLRLLDCLPQFLWLVHLVCGPDEPRCLLLFLPWMSSCASLFWNGSFGRQESLINVSAVTGEERKLE